MTNPQLRGTPFSVTATGTTSAQAVTTATNAGTNVIYYVTDLSGSGLTATGTWALLASVGNVIMWQGVGTVNATFSNPLRAPTTGTISFLVNGTTSGYATYANISGFCI